MRIWWLEYLVIKRQVKQGEQLLRDGPYSLRGFYSSADAVAKVLSYGRQR